MLFAFCFSLAALAEEPTADARSRGMRLYLSGGDAVVGGSHSGFASMGVQSVQQGTIVGGAFGAELSVFQPAGYQVVLPVVNLDGSLRITPWPDAKVMPYLTGGLGISFLLIVPFADVTLSVGAELPIGELRLYAELHQRAILPHISGQDPVNVSSLRLGVGF